MEPAEMEHLLREHSELEHRFDFDATMRTMTSDCYQHQVSLGLRCDGQADVKRYYEQLFGAFPDLIAPRQPGPLGTGYGEDTVWGWGSLQGTMRGPWFGLDATGRSFSTPVTYIIEFRERKLLGETLMFDAVSFCEQTGLHLPALKAAIVEAGRGTLIDEAQTIAHQSADRHARR